MFIHLRVHTAYSLLEGAIPVSKLITLAQQYGMPAVAMTDTGNLFGAMEFSEAAKKAGIQPLLGCQVQVQIGKETAPLIFLVQNQQGYQNLLKIVSYTYLKNSASPFIESEALIPWSEGLIVLTGGPEGGLARTLEQGQDGDAYLGVLQSLFKGRLYIEVSRQGPQTPDKERVEEALIDLAYAHDIPLVATNEAFFPDPSLYEAHDALLCIAEGTYVNEGNRRRVTVDHFFKSPAEMEVLFADLPEAIANTAVIAERCGFLLNPVEPALPSFPCEDEGNELRTQAQAGLEERLERYVLSPNMDKSTTEAVRKRYRDQLDYELSVIEKMKFSGYFLIVADFIKWAKSQHIPVGPGRGSGAGSVVAWSLTITDLDPLRFGLVFERFLNPERVSMPDFDIDFCQERRDEVIRYVRDKYGPDRVAHIITFGKLQARAVLRDVGRVLQLPYGQVDRICKLIPNNPAHPVTLEEALAQDPQLTQMVADDPEVARLMTLSQKLEGLYRHASTHAAGVVIGDRPLEEIVPLYYDPRSPLPATQFNMKYVEQAGLVKFDFLGLKTLTVIQQALDCLKERGIELDIAGIPLDDEKTFELLRRAETIGIFQMESGGMTDLMRKLKPDKFEDIIALGALYRPGPMDNIPHFIACRHGEEKANYLYPELEAILGPTYGIIVYQEQVMQIARDLAGYTLGGADLLRKAMGKKIKAEMNAQRKQFIDGLTERLGGNPLTAKALFTQIEKFASYAFAKAHAAAYALITYQTAYLKAHYPHEFMAALMSQELHNTDKLTFFAREVKRLGIELLPPDVKHSYTGFRVEKGSIRYALAALKNVGAAAMDSLVQERDSKGPFKDIYDFVERLDSRVLNKRQMESLVGAGVFDSLGLTRHMLWENLEMLLRYGNEDRSTPGLFDLEVTRPSLGQREEWPLLEKLNYEFAAVGFYLTSHPLDMYGTALKAQGVLSYADVIERKKDGPCRMAGIVITKQERIAKSGQRYAFVQLSDHTGVFEVTVFSELLSQYREILEPGTALLMGVTTQIMEDTFRFTAQAIERLKKPEIEETVTVCVTTESQVDQIVRLLGKASLGKTQVIVEVEERDQKAILALKPTYSLTGEEKKALQKLSA